MSNENQILTPAARLVQGSCFEEQTKDMDGNPLLVKSGPNMGQPRVSYYIGVAIPKTDAAWPALEAKIKAAAKAGFPTLFDAVGNLVNPQKGFAFKIIDGDDPLNAVKEGFSGHWILKFSNGFAPKVYTKGGAEIIVDPEMVKRGYYVRVAGSVKANGSMQQPGVFLNFSMVELIAHGEEIISGPNAQEVFGGTPASVPAGATAAPVANTAPIATSVTPAPDFATPPPPVIAAPAKKMTAKANGATYESVTSQGWTDEMLIQHGYMEA